MVRRGNIDWHFKGVREVFQNPAIRAKEETLANVICDTANSLAEQYAAELWPNNSFDAPFFRVKSGVSRYGTTLYSVTATSKLGDELQARYSVLTKAFAAHGIELGDK